MEEAPDIYAYHDYREFLRDWIEYRKRSVRGFSLRKLSAESGLAAGFLPMVLSGKRPLGAKSFSRLAVALGLGASERSYFEALVTLGTSASQQVRLDALERMKRFRAYRKHNPREVEAYQYLTHWYFVAIREMAAVPGFHLDPRWISEQLRGRVPLVGIKEAIRFLTESGFLKVREDGSVEPPEKGLECEDGVFRVALTQFHQEMLALAGKSIETVPAEERRILGHTFALRDEDFAKAQEIVGEALRRVRELEERGNGGDQVYHLELALFPLTRRSRK